MGTSTNLQSIAQQHTTKFPANLSRDKLLDKTQLLYIFTNIRLHKYYVCKAT